MNRLNEGNRTLNLILGPFGLKTCRHFGKRWSHGRKTCWCIISKNHKLNYQFEQSVGRYCNPCGLEMDELKEEDYRSDAMEEAKAEWCEAHPEDCECEEK